MTNPPHASIAPPPESPTVPPTVPPTVSPTGSPTGSPAQSPVQHTVEFHRLLRTHPRYRWWRPLVAVVAVVGLYVAIALAVMIPTIVVVELTPGLDSTGARLESFDMSDPVAFAAAMVSLILLLPAVLLAGLLCRGPGGRGLTGSITGRLRWGVLVRCTGWALAVLVPTFSLLTVVEADLGAAQVDRRALLMVLLTLALVPFQAAAEEYVFRGVLMQAVGSWLRHPAFAILLPVPLFVLGHGYDVYGQLDVAVFAIAAGWLSWRTGGLEAAIGLHVVVNTLLFLLAAVGLLDPNNAEGSLVGLTTTCVTTAAYAALVLTRAMPNVSRSA